MLVKDLTSGWYVGKIVCCYLLSIILMPILLPLFIISYLFKYSLKIYLRWKYKEKFAGLVEGSDVMFTVFPPKCNMIDIMIILSSDCNRPIKLDEALKIRIKKKILSNPKKYYKLVSRLSNIFFENYRYFQYVNITADDIVKVIKITENTKQWFKSPEEIFSCYTNKDLPKQNNLLWQILVIEAPRSWKLKYKLQENQHPMLLRIHHAVGDGIAIEILFLEVFCDSHLDFLKSFKKDIKSPTTKKNGFFQLLYLVHMSLLTPGYVIGKAFMDNKRENQTVFNPPTVICQKQLFIARNNDENLIEIIKRIKNKVTATTFMDVILSASSCSINDYLQKSQMVAPDVAITTIPLLPRLENRSTDLVNDVVPCEIILPINVNSKSMLHRLNEVKKCTKTLKHDLSPQVNYYIWKYYMGIIPSRLMLFLAQFTNISIGISNLPGCPPFKCCGYDGDHLFFYLPTFHKLGLSCTFFTYKNKLNIGVGADAGLWTSRNDVQKIADNIVQNIKILDKELCNNI